MLFMPGVGRSQPIYYTGLPSISLRSLHPLLVCGLTSLSKISPHCHAVCAKVIANQPPHGFVKKESEQPAHFEAASKVATIVMKAGACIHPQWIPGSMNTIANCLSRDFDLNDMLITKLFFSFPPLKTPFAFKIAPLPNKIVSWLTSLLQNQP